MVYSMSEADGIEFSTAYCDDATVKRFDHEFVVVAEDKYRKLACDIQQLLFNRNLMNLIFDKWEFGNETPLATKEFPYDAVIPEIRRLVDESGYTRKDLVFLAKDCYPMSFFNMFPPGLISFKAEGNCIINPLQINEGTPVPLLSVITYNGFVLCPTLDIYFDKTEIELMEYLYRYNSSLRIDYTISQWIACNSPDFEKVNKYITTAMCEYLSRREGMTKSFYDSKFKKRKEFRDDKFKIRRKQYR